MWRYIEDNDVSASFGLAADEYLVTTFNPPQSAYPRSHDERRNEPDSRTLVPTLSVGTSQGGKGDYGILRLYTYKSHCALVGRFQDIEKELNLDECKGRGIAVNRRPTGGGAILMGEDQLGITIVAPLSAGSFLGQSKALFETYSKGITFGLGRLGVEAEFRPKNDMLVNNKKIAGLALSIEETLVPTLSVGTSHNMLFHASVLLDMDIPLMLSVLNISREKYSRSHAERGNEPNSASERITTVSKELAKKVSMRELKSVIKLGFRDALAAEFNHEPFNANEIAAIEELEERKYKTTGWIYNNLVPSFARRR